MGRYGNLEYAFLTKTGFLVGAGMFALGALGEIVGRFVFHGLPGWEHLLFMYAEGLGILVGLFSVLLFGIVLPLTE
ncbi:DUF7860 family protein [Halopiger goleimassiliensis]|uniref:DUF7860 family protein n=1 Tax=Halopiger goleimassiliensis TaxID=1293048 RepID=UPI000677E840|nr:hypothetical protein [Halopiger goleimassiliensis]